MFGRMPDRSLTECDARDKRFERGVFRNDSVKLRVADFEDTHAASFASWVVMTAAPRKRLSAVG